MERRHAVLSFVVVLVGCGGTSVPKFSLSEKAVSPYQFVTLASSERIAPSTTVAWNGAPVPLRTLNDYTVAFAVPPTAVGNALIEVSLDSRHVQTISVSVGEQVELPTTPSDYVTSLVDEATAKLKLDLFKTDSEAAKACIDISIQNLSKLEEAFSNLTTEEQLVAATIVHTFVAQPKSINLRSDAIRFLALSVAIGTVGIGGAAFGVAGAIAAGIIIAQLLPELIALAATIVTEHGIIEESSLQAQRKSTKGLPVSTQFLSDVPARVSFSANFRTIAASDVDSTNSLLSATARALARIPDLIGVANTLVPAAYPTETLPEASPQTMRRELDPFFLSVKAESVSNNVVLKESSVNLGLMLTFSGSGDCKDFSFDAIYDDELNSPLTLHADAKIDCGRPSCKPLYCPEGCLTQMPTGSCEDCGAGVPVPNLQLHCNYHTSTTGSGCSTTSCSCIFGQWQCASIWGTECFDCAP